MSNCNKLREFLAEKAEMLAFIGTSVGYDMGLPAVTKGARARRLDMLMGTLETDAAIQYIHSGKVDVNRPAGAGNVTPLIYAAQMENVRLVTALLSKGANVFATDKAGFTAKGYASDSPYAGTRSNKIYALLGAAEARATAKVPASDITVKPIKLKV